MSMSNNNVIVQFVGFEAKLQRARIYLYGARTRHRAARIYADDPQ